MTCTARHVVVVLLLIFSLCGLLYFMAEPGIELPTTSQQAPVLGDFGLASRKQPEARSSEARNAAAAVAEADGTSARVLQPTERTAVRHLPACVDLRIASLSPVDPSPEHPKCVWSQVGSLSHEKALCNHSLTNTSLKLTLLHRAPMISKSWNITSLNDQLDNQLECDPFSAFTFSHAIDHNLDQATHRMSELIRRAQSCNANKTSLQFFILGGSVASGSDVCNDPENTAFHKSATFSCINNCGLWGRFRDWLAYCYPQCKISVK